MNTQEQLLLRIAAFALEGAAASDRADGADCGRMDWQLFHQLACIHEIVPLVHTAAKRMPVPAPGKYLSQWEQTFYYNLVRSQAAEQQFVRLSDLAQQAGIRLVPLKGVAFLATILSGHPSRMMSDIDVLVEDPCRLRAAILLEGAGYREELHGLKRAYWQRRHYHSTFNPREQTQPLPLELHWALDYPGAAQQRFLELVWSRVRPQQINGRQVCSLSPEDHFIALALHTRRLGNILSLKSAIDAAFLVRSQPRFDWNYAAEAARVCSCRSAVFFLISQVRRFLPGLIDDRTARAFAVSPRRAVQLEGFLRSCGLGRGPDNRTFLKATFILYDSASALWARLICLPLEQFARYFGLKPYALSTRVLFTLRFIYAPLALCVGSVGEAWGRTRWRQ